MKDFVNFDIANKLKEKGFKEQCLAYYTKDSCFYYNTSYGSDVENAFKSFNSRPNHICGKRIDTPTISQVLKWLREEKEFMVFPVYSTNTSRWYCSIVNADSLDTYKLSLSDSYEEAALAGIDYSLDNLI